METRYKFIFSIMTLMLLIGLVSATTVIRDTFSEFSGNASFDTNTLFIDADNDKVGIGTTTPSSVFEVVGSSTIESLSVTNWTCPLGAYAYDFSGGLMCRDDKIDSDGDSAVGDYTFENGTVTVDEFEVDGEITTPYSTFSSIEDVSSQGMVLALSFNDDSVTSTHTIDSSIKMNNGIIVDSTFSESNGFNNGGYMSFDGNNQSIDITSPADNSLSPQAFGNATWSFWMKPILPSGADSFIIMKGEGNKFEYSFSITASSYVKTVIWTLSGVVHSDMQTPISEDVWSHVAGVYDFNNSYKLYINGVLADTDDTMLGSIGYNDSMLQIAERSSPSTSIDYNGSIDDFRIYNRALSGEEVKSLYDLKKEIPRPVMTPFGGTLEADNGSVYKCIIADDGSGFDCS